MTVFSGVGVLASSLGVFLQRLVPLLDLVAAAILILMGAVMLLEIQLPFLSINVGPSRRRGLPGFYLFGIVYGMAGVGCSAPIFLSVLLHAMTKGPVNGLLTFAAYAVGMGIPLVVTSVLLAEAKDYVIARITRITPKLHTSVRASTSRELCACSGDMYAGEPSMPPVLVRSRESLVSLPPSTLTRLATPKSHTFTVT